MINHFKRALPATLAGALALVAGPALAEYPEKPITLIVPFKAGGSTETIGRVFSEALGEELGQRVIVKTRPGAGGAIGATELSKSAPDGYTIMFSTSAVLTWPPLAQDVPYTTADFTKIAQISEYQMAVVAKADAPFDTWPELIAYAKEHNLNYADQGSISKVYIDYMASQEGVSWTAIPTKGGGEAMPFLLGGKVDFSYSGGVHGRYGDKMKVLMALTPERHAASPDVPSITELYGFAMPAEAVISGPAGMDASVVATLEAAIEKAVTHEEFVKLLNENLKFPVKYADSATITASMASTSEALKKILATMGK